LLDLVGKDHLFGKVSDAIEAIEQGLAVWWIPLNDSRRVSPLLINIHTRRSHLWLVELFFVFFVFMGVDLESDPWRSLKWRVGSFAWMHLVTTKKRARERKGYVFHVSHWARVRINV
jgi:hypothetical protein